MSLSYSLLGGNYNNNGNKYPLADVNHINNPNNKNNIKVLTS